MTTSNFSSSIMRHFVFALLLLGLGAPAPLFGQGIRPGGTARGNTRTGGTGTGNVRTNTNSNSSTGSNGARQYRSNTLLGDAVIEIDPETRSLVIVTDEDTHRELSKVIRDLDRPKPQVLIKVVFLEVTYNKDSDIGVEGSYTFNLKNPVSASTGTSTSTTTTTASKTNSNGGTTTTNLVDTLTNPLGSAAQAARTVGASSGFAIPAVGPGTFVRVVQDDWSVTLRALQSKGKVQVLSRPSIMARNNQEAVIVVGQEVPFVTNSRTTDAGQTINTIQYDNVGIILRVTPFITSNNAVEMIVAPEISQLTNQTVAISSDVNSPIISKRSAETVVVTPNGSTAVIGGLMESQRLSTIQKVPLLGDIPVLGMAFRRTIQSDVKRELMIFLTPIIVNDPSTVGALTEKELAHQELVDKAFPKKEFQKFFDGANLNTPDIPNMETDKETVSPDRQPESTQIRRATPVVPVQKKVETTTVIPVSAKTKKTQ